MALGGLALGVVKRVIKRTYTLDLSGAATLRHLAALGYRVPTGRFYELRREVLASFPVPYDKFFTDPDRPVKQFKHIVTKDPFPTKYKYVVEIEMAQLETGSEYSFHTGIYSDKRLSQGDIQGIIGQRFDAPEYPGRRIEYIGEFRAIKTIQAFRHT